MQVKTSINISATIPKYQYTYKNKDINIRDVVHGIHLKIHRENVFKYIVLKVCTSTTTFSPTMLRGSIRDSQCDIT